METTIRRVGAASAALALAAFTLLVVGPVDPASAQEGEAAVTLELAPKNDSGIRGTASIYDLAEEEHEEAGAEEGAEHGEEENERHGEMHGHRVVVELRGLETGGSYPVHVHRGSCSEGGPVFLALESVSAGEDGSGTSNTEISAEQMAEKMKELMAEHREKMEAKDEEEGAGEHGDMGEHGGMEEHGEMHEEHHPSLFIQAHALTGAPAACGEIPMENKKEKQEDEGY